MDEYQRNALPLRLRTSADLCDEGDFPAGSALAIVQRLAADEIERLRGEVARLKTATSDDIARDLALAREKMKRERPLVFATHDPNRMDDIDRRLAALESSVRLHAHRIDAAREAMAECARDERLHNSVRMLADTLAINLRSGAAPSDSVEDAMTIKVGDTVGSLIGDRHDGVVTAVDPDGVFAQVRWPNMDPRIEMLAGLQVTARKVSP